MILWSNSSCNLLGGQWFESRWQPFIFWTRQLQKQKTWLEQTCREEAYRDENRTPTQRLFFLLVFLRRTSFLITFYQPAHIFLQITIFVGLWGQLMYCINSSVLWNVVGTPSCCTFVYELSHHGWVELKDFTASHYTKENIGLASIDVWIQQ